MSPERLAYRSAGVGVPDSDRPVVGARDDVVVTGAEGYRTNQVLMSLERPKNERPSVHIPNADTRIG